MTPVRLAVLPDFREERWPSMDLCADMLVAHLPPDTPGQFTIPPYRRVAGRLPLPAGRGIATNLDRLVNRFVVYPRFARRLTGQFDTFHVADHSYAHLVHALPPGRAGVYCHDLDAFRCLIEPEKDPRPRWFRALARRALAGLQAAAVVFTNSHETRRELLHFGLVPGERIVPAPLGAAPEFTPAAAASPVAVPWLTPAAGRPWLLHVGSCIPRKRIDVLLDVFAAARDAIPGLMLVKVGGEFTPPQREQIRRRNLEPSLVHVSNVPRTELAEAYRRAAVVLVPSGSEGFGLPVLEALACGAAVVASDLPVLREVGGTAVTFAPVGDVPAWAAAVVSTLAGGGPSRAARLARAAQFSWAAHAAIIAAEYRRIAGG